MVYIVAKAMGPTLFTGATCTIKVVPEVQTELTISVVDQPGAVGVALRRVAVVATATTAIISRSATSVVKGCRPWSMTCCSTGVSNVFIILRCSNNYLGLRM